MVATTSGARGIDLRETTVTVANEGSRGVGRSMQQLRHAVLDIWLQFSSRMHASTETADGASGETKRFGNS